MTTENFSSTDAKAVFEEWSNERDKVFALVYCIERALRPQSDADDSTDYNAWRISQVVMDLLADARTINFLKSCPGVDEVAEAN